MKFVLQYQPKDRNEWVELDMGDETPAMVYQLNTIGELKERQTSGSRALSLPKTPHNLQTLGFLDTPDVIAEAAYQPRPCRLFMDGALISPSKAVLYVNSIELQEGGNIQTQIVSGVKDLFTQLGEVESSPNHPNWANKVWTSDAINAANTSADSPLRWPLLSSIAGDNFVQLPVKDEYNTMQIFRLVPCYHLMTFVKELFEAYGYALESDLLDDDFANSLYITASKITEPAQPTVDAVLNSFHVPAITPLDRGFDISQSEFLSGGYIEDGKIAHLSYYAPQAANYAIGIRSVGTGYGNYTYAFKVILHKADGTMTRVIDKKYPSTGDVEDTFDCNMAMGEWVDISIGTTIIQTEVQDTTDISISITLAEDETSTGIGSKFNIGQSLGIKKYSDFVKAFLQLFGAVIDVRKPASEEEVKGLVRIYTYAGLYRRIKTGQFEDWTDKLVLNSERTDSFAIENYAQQNTILLKANEANEAADSMSFPVNNASLDAQKDLFTIGFEAGRSVNFSNITADTWPAATQETPRTFSSVPTLEGKESTSDDEQTVELKYKGCTAHIVQIARGDYYEQNLMNFNNVTGYRQYGETFASLKMPPSAAVPLSEFRTRYYESLAQMLHNARRVTAYFKLTSLDIARLDMLTPVYLDMYGAYFYINKINNFGVKPYTEVELIKL